MSTYDFVHLVFFASAGNRIQGRTKLQKVVYFVGALANSSHSLGYRAHFYGPYSSDVSVAVDDLRGLGFLTQKTSSIGSFDSRGFEMARYDYELTEAGKIVADEKAKSHPEEWRMIQEAVQRLSAAKADDYVKLSIAAKSYFMVQERKRAISPEERAQITAEYGWKVSPDQFREADQLLKSIELSQTTAS